MHPINVAVNFTQKHNVINWSNSEFSVQWDSSDKVKYAESPVNAIEAIAEDR